MRAKKSKKAERKVGNGFVKKAWQNVGHKSPSAYYNGRNNRSMGKALSAAQLEVLKEYDRLVEEATKK